MRRIAEMQNGAHGLPDFPGYDSFAQEQTLVQLVENGNGRVSASKCLTGGQTRQPDTTPSVQNGGNGTVSLPRPGPVSAFPLLLRMQPW